MSKPYWWASESSPEATCNVAQSQLAVNRSAAKSPAISMGLSAEAFVVPALSSR